MPTYEYECRSCHRRFERLQSFAAKPVSVCPKCGKRSVKRLISSGAGLLFKGSGFYATDYRSSGYKKQASEESPPKADPPRSVADKSCSGEPKSCSGGPCSTKPKSGK